LPPTEALAVRIRRRLEAESAAEIPGGS
jgi:hypothetical protein